MLNIYDLAYQILFDITNDFVVDDTRDTYFKDFLDFLTSDNTKLEKVFDRYKDWNNISRKSLKITMMLIVFSTSYLKNLYDVKRDVDYDDAIEEVESLETLTVSDIIALFYEQDENIKRYLEDYLEYSSNSYIYRNACWQNLLMEQKASQLLKINPLEILNYDDAYLGDAFKEMENVIQILDDLYSKSLNEAYNDSEFATDEDIESVRQHDDCLVMEKFYNNVWEHFAGNQAGIAEFYLLIFANVYEKTTITIPKKKSLKKKRARLLQLLEENSNEDLIAMFENNWQFAIEIIDTFISINDGLEKEELINRRLEFLKVGNITRLNEFNVYHQRDEIVLKRHKKTGLF